MLGKLCSFALVLGGSLVLACATSPPPDEFVPRPKPGGPAKDLHSSTPAEKSQPEPEDRDPLDTPLDVARPSSEATFTPSGLASRVLRKGSGTQKPKAEDTVVVHYTGWTTDGKRFDSSHARGEPATFPLNAVIRGWTEGLQLMVVGEKRRFWIPAHLAYGNDPNDNRPDGTLVFDVELLSIR